MNLLGLRVGKLALPASIVAPESWFTCQECKSEALVTGSDKCLWCDSMLCETCIVPGDHEGCRDSSLFRQGKRT